MHSTTIRFSLVSGLYGSQERPQSGHDNKRPNKVKSEKSLEEVAPKVFPKVGIVKDGQIRLKINLKTL